MRRSVFALVVSLAAACHTAAPAPAAVVAPATPLEAAPTTAAQPAAVADPALRRELLDRVERDQVVRRAWMADSTNEAELARVMELDRDNVAWMKTVISQHGWPGWRLVGEDGSSAAWLLVQHADADLAFQKACLAKLDAAVDSGDASATDRAYLHDRVAVAEGRPQRYGTQFGADGPMPIEDEPNVDARRAALGMPSMADYAKAIGQ